jgi:NifB/MoaA-like Fe-S oxidoreductase
LNCSTDADLQHELKTEDVLEGSVPVLPTAQAMSVVGKVVKDAVAQEGVELELGAGADILRGCEVWRFGGTGGY